MASTVFAAPSIAVRASPFRRSPLVLAAVRPSLSSSEIASLETVAFGPSSHSTGKSSRALIARHQVSATTATVLSSTLTTPRNPGWPAILASL